MERQKELEEGVPELVPREEGLPMGEKEGHGVCYLVGESKLFKRITMNAESECSPTL